MASIITKNGRVVLSGGNALKYELGQKTLTANGTYIASDDGCIGYDRVVVDFDISGSQPTLKTPSFIFFPDKDVLYIIDTTENGIFASQFEILLDGESLGTIERTGLVTKCRLVGLSSASDGDHVIMIQATGTNFNSSSATAGQTTDIFNESKTYPTQDGDILDIRQCYSTTTIDDLLELE